ncbi:MAG TPA: multidrug efflux SMR transporter [Phycisphaerales bacterium]|nr:multidrug efflux SMR transporter [Phycisphaerales bacterium]
MVYFWLALAVVFEVGWAISMKLSDGFSRLWPSAATVAMYLLSVVFLALATRRMDVGVAYAIWAGCGVSLIAVAGIVWFKEPASALKIASLALILLGIVGLQLAGAGRH